MMVSVFPNILTFALADATNKVDLSVKSVSFLELSALATPAAPDAAVEAKSPATGAQALVASTVALAGLAMTLF